MKLIYYLLFCRKANILFRDEANIVYPGGCNTILIEVGIIKLISKFSDEC